MTNSPVVVNLHKINVYKPCKDTIYFIEESLALRSIAKNRSIIETFFPSTCNIYFPLLVRNKTLIH